jgi:hypothetical protein
VGHVHRVLRPGWRAIALCLTNAPAGISIDPVTGVITGTLSSAGSYGITVRVEDADHIAVEQQLWLEVRPWEWHEVVYRQHGDTSLLSFEYYLDGAFPQRNGAGPFRYLLSSATSSPLPSGLSVTRDANGEPMLVAQTTRLGFSAQVLVHALYAGSPGYTLTKALDFELRVQWKSGGGLDPYMERIIATDGEQALVDSKTQTVASDTLAREAVTTNTYLLPIDETDDGGGGSSGGSGGGYYAPIVGPGPTFIRTDVYGGGALPFKSLWFDYDANYHVVIGNAKLEGGQIKLGAISAYDPDISYQLSYDSMGNVTQRRHLGQDKITTFSTEFTYDLRGQKKSKTNDHAANGLVWVAEDYIYNDAKQLVQQQEYYGLNYDAQHRVHRRKTFLYDKDGRQTLVQNRLGGTFYRLGFYTGYLNSAGEGGSMGAGLWRFADGIPEQHNLPSEIFGFAHTSDQVTYYDDQRDGQMSNLYVQTYTTDAGNYTDIGPYLSRYEYIYDKRETYLERGVSATSSNANFVSKTTDSTYDIWSRRLTATDGSTTRKFLYSEDGQILRRRQGRHQRLDRYRRAVDRLFE